MHFIVSKRPTALWASCGALALAMVACSHDREPARTAGVTSSAVAAAEYSDASQSAADDKTATIQVSQEFRTRCNLPKDADAAPRFDYDQATLHSRGENILDSVAQCLRQGPLKGETITLIGRADPRGSEQYNRELGRSRAAAARDYLVQRGVPIERIRLVSRGEQGAQGSNEATWALDRRVDLELGDKTSTTATANATGTGESPIIEGTKLQIETSESKREEHPNAMSYSDTAEGGKPTGSVGTGSSSSGTVTSGTAPGPVQGSASGSVNVGTGATTP